MKKITSLLVALLMILSSVCVAGAFSDIDSVTISWAGEAIEKLTESGVINGYEDGTFRPENNVTRAEFAKMVSVAFDLAKSEEEYDDISLHWARDYILSAGSSMYTDGANFEPDKPASRADIAYCAASVLKLESAGEDLIKKYPDGKEVVAQMADMVFAAAENKIIIGYEDGTIRPNNPVTRAEAAVIICRALNLKNKPETDPVLPPVADEDGKEQKDHLSNLYPGKDIILVDSVTRTSDPQNGDDAYKINYLIAGDDIEYSSVVPYDTAVTGIKNDISALCAGDVLIMNTAFHGYIGSLHVFASFGGGVFNFDHTVTGYGKGDYTLAGGKIKAITSAGKNSLLTLEAGGVENLVYVPANAETMEYSLRKSKNRWSWGDLSNVDPETEEECVFIRYTNGVATEIIVSDFQ